MQLEDLPMANSTKASREALRKKIAARKATKGASSPKWNRLRQVAAEEAKDVDSALTEVADALGNMADAMGNLREHLDLIEAPKTASLKVRVATSRRYASSFRRLADENPEVVADALSEVYHSLDDVAGAVENLAEHMGIELNLTPVEEAFGEEGKEELKGESPAEESEEVKVDIPEFEAAEEELESEDGEKAEEKVDDAEEKVEGEVEKEAASIEFTTDRDEKGEPKTPVVAAKKGECSMCGPGHEDPKKPGYCERHGKRLSKENPCDYGKKAGATEWTTDRDEDGKPKTPAKVEAPQAQGESEENKTAAVPGGFFAEDKQWDLAPDPKYDENPPDDWEECGQCECYHPAGYTGDCRSDINRWPSDKSIAVLTGKPEEKPVTAAGEFFTTDRDNEAKPETPVKVEIPEAQGESEENKAAAAKIAMTKKDYVLLADAIRSYEVDEATKKNLALHLSGFLKRDNPRFLQDRFVAYVAGEVGPSGGKLPSRKATRSRITRRRRQK